MSYRTVLFPEPVKMGSLKITRLPGLVQNRNVRPILFHAVDLLGTRVKSTLVVYTGAKNTLRVVS